MEFWMFSFDDPKLINFCEKCSEEEQQLYCIMYIQNVPEYIPDYVRESMRLHNDTVLMVESFLMPLYVRLNLSGYIIVISENFCALDEYKALLKLTLFHSSQRGVVVMDSMSQEIKHYFEMCYEEYKSQYDDLQPTVLRNLCVNMKLVSSELDYEKHLKAGHLLSDALKFVSLLSCHVAKERKKAFYANQMAITDKALDKTVKSIFNKKFRDIVVYQIISNSIKKLMFTDMTITKIAHGLGFDVSDFNQTFRKRTGMLPSELR